MVWSPNNSMIAYYKPTRIAASNGREDWTDTIETVSLRTGRVIKIGVGVNFSWSLDSKKIMWMKVINHQSHFIVSNAATGAHLIHPKTGVRPIRVSVLRYRRQSAHHRMIERR
jgi:hypothetical protein